MQRFVAVMLFGAVVLFSSVSVSSAQGFKGRWGIQPFVSYAVPTGDFGTNADPGFMFGAKLRKNLNYYFSMDLVADFGPKFNLSSDAFEGNLFAFVTDDEGNPIDQILIEDAEGDYAITRFALDNNIYVRNDDIRPYLCFGIGAYRIKQDFTLLLDNQESVPVSETETKAGVAFGAGVEAALGDRTAAVLDFKFHTAQDGFRTMTFGAGLNFYFDAY